MKPLLPLVLLSSLVAILSLVLAMVWFGGDHTWTAPNPEPPSPDALVPIAIDTSAPEVPQYVEQVARPLFIAGRRPPVDEPRPVAATAPVRLPVLRLVGVFGSGDERGVLLRTPDGIRRMLVGDDIDGFTLREVSESRAILSADGEDHVLELRSAGTRASGDSQLESSMGARSDQDGGSDRVVRPDGLRDGQGPDRPRGFFGGGGGSRLEDMFRPRERGGSR